MDTNASGEVSLEEICDFFEHVSGASLDGIAKQWVGGTSVDCGTDLAPPITSRDVKWYHGVCGGIGGCVSRTLTAPLERIKIIAQTRSTSSPTSIITEFRTIFKEAKEGKGIRSLFAGNAINCFRCPLI